MPPPFLAGLHLGLLQAGYLLALSRALSSAHTTYALVLTAWLAGAALGLWWSLRPRIALAIGLFAYLAVQGWLASVDFVAAPPWGFAAAVAASVSFCVKVAYVRVTALAAVLRPASAVSKPRCEAARRAAAASKSLARSLARVSGAI